MHPWHSRPPGTEKVQRELGCRGKSRWSPQQRPFRKVPSSLLLQPPALFRQFNSSTPDALLCTALASSGEKRQEARRAFALRVTRHAIPPSRGADAVHDTLAHRCAIFLCSLDVLKYYLTRHKKSSQAINYATPKQKWSTISLLLPAEWDSLVHFLC